MFSFHGTLFFKNFSCNFCFRFDDAKRLLVILRFLEGMQDLIYQGKLSRNISRHHWVRYWIHVSQIHFRESISWYSYRSCIFYSICYFYFLSLESSLCFAEIVELQKWLEMSVFKMPARFYWSLKGIATM